MADNYREPEDLLSDESFLAWYFKTGGNQGSAWEHWMAAHPGNTTLVQQAVEILNTTRLGEKELPPQQIDRAEAALMKKIAAWESTTPAAAITQSPDVTIPQIASLSPESKPLTTANAPTAPVPKEVAPIVPLHKDRRWIAAACVLVLFTSGLLLNRAIRTRRPEVRTEYGQISRQQLPDGTEVTMNANSQLNYSPGWKDGIDREVWVKGEAFFHVRRTPMKSRFIVHTDHFDIIVTGTKFNVVNRHGKDNVLLEEGSVILLGRDGRELHLAPGDFVEFNSSQLEKRPAKNDSVLAWKEQRLVFDRTPLRELVSIINDQYGVAVQLADDSIGDRTISAILPNNNLDILLQALEATSEFDVVREKGGITIKAHSQQN